MPYKQMQSDGLVVESEGTRTTLRVFDNGERVFSCEVTTASPSTARITNASGQVTVKIHRAVQQWLALEGFKFYAYERDGKNENTYMVKG